MTTKRIAGIGPLTPKKERFCEEYLVDFNGTRAAIRSGYSRKTARSQAQRLLTNVDVQKRLGELRNRLSKVTGVTVESVMKAVAEAARMAKRKGNLVAWLKALEMQAKHVGAFEKDNIQRAFVLHIQ